MADVLTAVLGLVKQTIGGNRNTWGGINNTNFDAVEAALAGLLNRLVIGGSVTLTDAERRNRILNFNGALASDQTVVIANLPSVWLVCNGTDGDFDLSFKTAAGDAVSLAQGQCGMLWCDGADTMQFITAVDVGAITFAMLATSLIAVQADAQGLIADAVLMTPQQTWNAIWAFNGNFVIVLDKDTLAAPASPAEGDRYFVNGTGTGGWAGGTFDLKIVEFRNAVWNAFSPSTEQRIVVRDEKIIYRWTGTELLVDLPHFPVLAPAQITASQNDYQPTGRESSGALVLDLDANHSVTGIVANFDGEILPIVNGSASTLTLPDASVLSAAANRFSFGFDMSIGAGKTALLIYQAATVNRWKLLVAPASTKAGFQAFGQCQLAKSGSNLLLSPCKGNLITINSAPEILPDAGVSLGGAGSSGTLGYIYAFMNSGVMTLESSATAPAVQAGTGVSIKTGDATRTLVGMAYPATGPAWVDSANQRFVRSWFNDPGIGLVNHFSADRTSTSPGYTEINSEIRCEFLVWAGEVPFIAACGFGSNNGGSFNNTALAIDGTTAEDAASGANPSSGGARITIGLALAKTGLAEGYHYATLVGLVGSGTGTWSGNASPGLRTTLTVSVRH